MSLSKNSDRQVITLSIKKTTAEKFKRLSHAENRKFGQQFDIIIENIKE